jgi:hypothetical protein
MNLEYILKMKLYSQIHEDTKGVYYNIMNDIDTFRLFLNTSHKDFLAWEKYNARLNYLEEVCEYLKVGPYALV